MRLLHHSLVPAVLATAALAIGPAPVSAQPHRPDSKRVLCLLSDWGRPRCVNLDELRRQIPPQQYAQLLAQLERLVSDLGLDPSKDAVLPCGRTAHVPPVSLEKSFNRKRADRLGPGDLRKLTDLAAGCRTAALGRPVGGAGSRGGLSGPSASYDAWVSSTVSEVDGDMSGCRDHTNPWVAEDGSADFKKNKPGTVGVINLKPKTPPSAPPTFGFEDSLFFSGNGKDVDAGSPDGGTPSGTGTPAKGAGSPAEPTLLDRVVALLAAMWQEDAGPATTPPSTPPTTMGPTPAPQPGMPCDPDLGCTATCEQRQQAWDMFKAMCEQSHWRAFSCVDFLRKVNGCADMTLINPGPEGDLTCPRWGRETEAERRQHAWSEQCKHRQMVMMPTQDGRPMCVDRTFAQLPRPTIDPCHDPRALPGPDDCGTGGGTPIVDPSPRPMPDPHR